MKLTKKEANKISKIYNLGKLKSHKKIPTGFINHSFYLITNKGSYIVQILGVDYTSWKEKKIKLEFDILDYLKKKKFPYKIPEPIVSDDGEKLRRFGNKRFWVYRKIKGKINQKINLIQFKKVAKALAIFHKLTEGFRYQGDDFDNYKWLFGEYKKMRRGVKPKNRTDRLMLDHFDWYIKILKRVRKVDFGRGIMVHDDFNNSNMIFSGNKLIGIIDFDNIGKAPKVNDVVNAIDRNHLTKKKDSKIKEDVFLKEYRKISSFTRKEENLMNLMRIKRGCLLFWWTYSRLKKNLSKRYMMLKDWNIEDMKKLLKRVNWDIKLR